MRSSIRDFVPVGSPHDTLATLCQALTDVIARMLVVSDEEDWPLFWSLNEQRHTLSEGLHAACQDATCVAEHRELLLQLLAQNETLQRRVENVRAHTQQQVLGQRQQRRGAKAYASNGAVR